MIRSTNFETQTKPTTQLPLIYHTGHFLPVPSCASLLPAYTGYIPVISSPGTSPVICSMGHLTMYRSTGSSQLSKETRIVHSCVHLSTTHPSTTIIEDRSARKSRAWTANGYSKNNSKSGTKRPKYSAKK